MSFIFYNPNPDDQFVGDCVIRAVSRVTHQDWDTTYDDKFGANIGVPTGETVGAVSLALAIDGSADNTTVMTATPAAVEELFNVGRCVSMSIWNGCCESLAVQNVGTTPVTVNAPRISINR